MNARAVAASASARQWAGAAPGKGGLGQAAQTDPFKFKLPVRPPAPLASGVAAAAQAATCKSGSR